LPKLQIDRFDIGRFRSSFLPALLVVALGVTGVVSLRGYRTAQVLRATLESTLEAYVSFVAEHAQKSTELAIMSCAEFWLAPVMTPDGGPDDIHLHRQCGEEDGGRFELDITHGSIISATGLAAAHAQFLLETIPDAPRIEPRSGWHMGTLTTVIDGRSEIVPYVVHRAGDRETAIGFLPIGALSFALDAAITKVAPPEKFKKPNSRLTDFFYVGSNQRAAATNRSASLYMQRRALNPALGPITVEVGILPAGLYELAPSGVPHDRGFEFLALFGLAAALVFSSVLLLRREEQLARTRANFVAGVSHELRTPLAQIRMFAEMLLLGRVRTEADRRRSLEIIDTEARRLSQLVENVLQVARSENGHLHVNPINMHLAPIVRECVESFSILAQARSIEFRSELQEDLVAPVDSAALRQIVLNLLDNAAKYGPVGQRVVTGVALFDNQARIWIDDEGAGVPVRERERVFDPFYRMRDAQHTTGSGIGLSVVRELVALHGGEVWIENAPDAGARVVVQFPGAYLSTGQATGDIAVA
jgi:signal transduction histidine kinase